MIVLLDSDILIEIARGRSVEVIARWSELASAQYAILFSPVSIAEVWQGALQREHPVLARFFEMLTCVPIDAEIGREAGEFLHAYHKSHRLELGDALIAASAIRSRALLWTRNRKHYPMRALAFF
jgi:predicted nucleic acid-binding protein